MSSTQQHTCYLKESHPCNGCDMCKRNLIDLCDSVRIEMNPTCLDKYFGRSEKKVDGRGMCSFCDIELMSDKEYCGSCDHSAMDYDKLEETRKNCDECHRRHPNMY